jgi:hypothetical protein
MVLEIEEVIVFYRVISRVWIEFFSTFEERMSRSLVECVVIFQPQSGSACCACCAGVDGIERLGRAVLRASVNCEE